MGFVVIDTSTTSCTLHTDIILDKTSLQSVCDYETTNCHWVSRCVTACTRFTALNDPERQDIPALELVVSDRAPIEPKLAGRGKLPSVSLTSADGCCTDSQQMVTMFILPVRLGRVSFISRGSHVLRPSIIPCIKPSSLLPSPSSLHTATYTSHKGT